MDNLQKLIKFLEELENRKIYYRLNKIRDSILVEISVPSQRWEVEYMYDGRVNIEKYISDGNISGEEDIENLLRDFGDLATMELL